MGESEHWWPELASGLSAEGVHSFRAAFETFRRKGEGWWAQPELQVSELIAAIQPNAASEFRRPAVADYIAKLIQSSCTNCQVEDFGSVPLKTYLPDGDIDLTVLSPNPEVKRTWIDDVHNVLQKEISNPNSEFRITEVQLVDAEVKLIKIFVEKLLVDVSFDQLGGLCTLCFLEEVDRLIGEDHLFKRSIILVKAWCYYESRLLGANCNLMSTYALETLVLYIFHLFHASLRGPLQEIERQSIIEEDLHRLVLSSRREGRELLFTKAFLDACERTYGSLRVNQVAKPVKFPVKSLNIMDPLRSTNNLGRSVNQGNCARIRRAFVLGARTLRGILHGNDADVSTVLDQFFKSCKERYDGISPRPDVVVPRSWRGTRMPNSVQRMGGGRRSDIARSERNEEAFSNAGVPENGENPPQARLFRNVLRVYPRDPTFRETSEEALGNGVEYESGGIGAESTGNFTSGPDEEAGALNSRDTKIAINIPNGNLTAHYSRHIELIRGDDPLSKRIPSQTVSLQIDCDGLPISSSAPGDNGVSSGIFSERTSSTSNQREGVESRARNMGGSNVSKQFSTAIGGQHSIVCSASPRSKKQSEGKEEPLSQSISEENFESRLHGSSSELLGRPPDPQRSPSDFACAKTEVQSPSTSIEPSKTIGNDAGLEFSVPADYFMQTGMNAGSPIPGCAEMSQSKVPARKGKIHQQNGTFHGNDFGSGLGHVKRKRVPGKERGNGRAAGMIAQDGGPVSCSSSTAHIPQQSSVLASAYQHSPCHSSTDFTTSGTHFKTFQTRPYLNATGPGSFRHPLANSQFDPGTTRTTGGNNSAASHSSDPPYISSYYPPLGQFPPGFTHPSMYSLSLNNFHSRNSPARVDGSSEMNATSRTDQELFEPLRIEDSVDSPCHKRQSIFSVEAMPQVAVGVVERLEAGGKAASTSSRRNQTAAGARNNAHGARVPNGNINSEILTGDLKRHLKALAFGRFCEDWCSQSVQCPTGYPAYGSEQLAHTHGSCEGPGRPAQFLDYPFYAAGPVWLPLSPQQAGYFPQPYWSPPGVQLSPRPRGPGTPYLPNS